MRDWKKTEKNNKENTHTENRFPIYTGCLCGEKQENNNNNGNDFPFFFERLYAHVKGKESVIGLGFERIEYILISRVFSNWIDWMEEEKIRSATNNE